jgi:hypothetical protein
LARSAARMTEKARSPAGQAMKTPRGIPKAMTRAVTTARLW